MKKITIFFLLIISLILSNTTFATSVAPQPFSDVPISHPNYLAISDLKLRGIISGYPDGTFRPDQPVSRVEALKIILLAFKIPLQSEIYQDLFPDTDKTQWYQPYLATAVSLKIVNGYPDGTFQPLNTVKLVENLKMAILAGQINLSSIIVNIQPYADTPIFEWYIKYVQYAKNLGLIDADIENKVYPSQPLSRGKLAEVIDRLLVASESTPDTIAPPAETTPPSDSTPPTDTTTPPLTTDVDTTPPVVVVYQVNIKDFAFNSNDLIVPVGMKVRWTNSDSASHTVTFNNSAIPSSGMLSNGNTYEYTFNTLGTFSYYCSPHPSMTGKITVKPANEVPTI